MSRRPRPRPPADDRGGLGDVGTGSGVGGAGELTAEEVAALRADDALLDALGRGEPVAGDDELAAMLGAWRAEMDTEPLPSIDVTGVVPEPDLDGRPYPWSADAAVADQPRVADAAGALPAMGRVTVRPAAEHAATPPLSADAAHRAATGAASVRPAGGPDDGARPPDGRPGRVRSRRWSRGARLAVAVAVVLAAIAGLSITADRGGPGGPLWTVVRLVDPAGASQREAQDAVAKAEKAVAQGRFADAGVLVDRAQPLVDRVRVPAERAALQKRLDAVRAIIAGAPIPAPGATNGDRTPRTPTTTPNPGTTTGPGGAAPGGAAGNSGGATPGQTGGGLLGGPAPSSQPPILPTCLLSLPPVHIPPLPPLC
jgi:hypothetical protein